MKRQLITDPITGGRYLTADGIVIEGLDASHSRKGSQSPTAKPDAFTVEPDGTRTPIDTGSIFDEPPPPQS